MVDEKRENEIQELRADDGRLHDELKRLHAENERLRGLVEQLRAACKQICARSSSTLPLIIIELEQLRGFAEETRRVLEGKK